MAPCGARNLPAAQILPAKPHVCACSCPNFNACPPPPFTPTHAHALVRRKGQGTNEMLFGGVSLAETQQQSLDKMKNLQDKGLDVEIK